LNLKPPQPRYVFGTNEAIVAVTDATRLWLERAVIGLNLCPFARAAHSKQQIRYVVTGASNSDELLDELEQELEFLSHSDPSKFGTTLLIHPNALPDFLQYNDFLAVADALLKELVLDGELQVASFHPQYQFADSGPDDIENYSNRSPYATLHILREDSVTQAVAAFPNAEDIYVANINTLRALGHDGWQALWRKPSEPALEPVLEVIKQGVDHRHNKE
jgi:uncharacterized protein